MKKITLPDGIEAIDNNTFDGCTSLTEVTIPSSVTFIAEEDELEAFRDCPNLKRIITPKGSYAEQWAKKNGYEVVSE